MRILPNQHFKLISEDPPHELVGRLRPHVQARRPFVRWGAHKLFWGSVDVNGFRIQRVGKTRNSFRPTMYGQFSRDTSGTLVDVDVHVDWTAVVVILIFAFFFGHIGGQVAAAAITASQSVNLTLPPQFVLTVLVGVATAVLLIALTWLLFPAEAQKGKQELEAALGSTPPRGP